MRKRFVMKLAALTVSGGLMFQLAGCAPLLLDLVFQQVLTSVLASAVQGALDTNGSTDNMNANDNSTN